MFPRKYNTYYSPWGQWRKTCGKDRQIAASVIAQGAKDVRRTMEMELQAQLAIDHSLAKE